MKKLFRDRRIVILEALFLAAIYAAGLYFRLAPRLEQDPRLLTFEADIWYRLTMAQYLLDHGGLPVHDIRYEAYTDVPFWYPPFSLYALAGLSKISGLGLPAVASRIIPFLESLTPLGFYVFARVLYGPLIALSSTLFLCLTPSFIFWSGICDPQSFILFMIPLLFLFWIKHAERLRHTEFAARFRLLSILAMGLACSVSFLTHLFFLLIPFLLVLLTLGLSFQRGERTKLWLDLGAVLLVSQLLTVWWWGPKNLYWWWIQGLVTSSGYYPAGKQLENFGAAAALCTAYAVLIILIRRFSDKECLPQYTWIPFLWILIPLVQTQNESLLTALGRLDLSWNTLFKPLEGFRFYPFVAQPAALIFGIACAGWTSSQKVFRSALPLVFMFLVADMHYGYRFNDRIKNAGFTLEEIGAAEWYREHSKPTDRIIADYYRAYMFAGFSGGRALLGMAFPLRNVEVPCISRSDYRVPDDIHRIYTTDDPKEAVRLMKRYGATHLLISSNMASNGNFITKGFGVKYNYKTLQDTRYFTPVYQDKGKVVIVGLAPGYTKDL